MGRLSRIIQHNPGALLFIYLTLSGPSCIMRGLSLQCTDSLVVACMGSVVALWHVGS